MPLKFTKPSLILPLGLVYRETRFTKSSGKKRGVILTKIPVISNRIVLRIYI